MASTGAAEAEFIRYLSAPSGGPVMPGVELLAFA
jgi:hypothetical protein